MHARAAEFREGNWTAGVVGLGYVGVPLAVAATNAGLNVVGLDISRQRVEDLADGRSPSVDTTDEQIRSALSAGFHPTTDESELASCDAVFVCVPSPLGRNREPDLSHITEAVEMLGRVIKPMTLVSLESTTYPGTTDELVLPTLQRSGFVLDESLFVAFSPERVSPGDPLEGSKIPKIVGGVSETSTAVAVAAYARIFDIVHPVGSARAAELTKLLENTYRAVNIGLINEIAMLAHELDIDIWEVIEGAATKPFGFQAFYPGPGVGGHCIPLDPQYLAWRAREARFTTRFIDTAEQVNASMPTYTAGRATEILNDMGKAVRDARILGVGIAYKPNVGDDRESAAVEVLSELQRWGADITVLDPLISDARILEHGFAPADDILGEYDLAIVLTDHTALNLSEVADSATAVFDTRNAFRNQNLSFHNVSTL